MGRAGDVLEAIDLDRPRRARDPGRRRRRRISIGVILLLTLAAAVSVPVIVRDATRRPDRTHEPTRRPRHVDAKAAVIAAVDATRESGSYTVDFESTEHPNGVFMSGRSTISLDPKGMVASSHSDAYGDVTVRVNDTTVWEYGGADYGLAPGSTDTGPGAPLSGFADLVLGTIGRRAGAVGMLAMASPGGYLEIARESIANATRIGTSTVRGVPVTVYRVDVDATGLADQPGMTTEQKTTMAHALDVLRAERYTRVTVEMSIDDHQLVRHSSTTWTFADGGTVFGETTFAGFGCSGTVTMPGEVPAPDPEPCDPGNSPTTTAP